MKRVSLACLLIFAMACSEPEEPSLDPTQDMTQDMTLSTDMKASVDMSEMSMPKADMADMADMRAPDMPDMGTNDMLDSDMGTADMDMSAQMDMSTTQDMPKPFSCKGQIQCAYDRMCGNTPGCTLLESGRCEVRDFDPSMCDDANTQLECADRANIQQHPCVWAEGVGCRLSPVACAQRGEAGCTNSAGANISCQYIRSGLQTCSGTPTQGSCEAITNPEQCFFVGCSWSR